MTTRSAELGPIDYVVVELPYDTTEMTEQMSTEITSLVESRLIRILDLLYIRRDDDGRIEVTEFEDTDDPRLGILDGALAEILALEDVDNLAAAVGPGHRAAVIIWEYLCAIPFADAARADGGNIVAQGRIPAQAIVATLQGDVG